jgi:hypothetical protein
MLNQSQRRRLSTVLGLTEERMLELRRRLAGGEPRPCILEIDNDLTDRERAAAEEKIDALLDLIRNASAQLALDRRRQSLRAMLFAVLSLSWATLQEAKASGLRAYGETDPRLKELLDPMIDRIGAAVMELVRNLSGAGNAGSP